MGHLNSILIVDDDTTAVELLADLLRSNGFSVKTATSSHEALAELARRSYKAIVTDLRMPDGSGMELLDHCTATFPETPVVMLTAHGTIQNAVEAVKRGAVDYLTKPVQVDELVITITKAIEQRRIETENRYLREELDRNRSFLYASKCSAVQEVYRVIETVKDVNSTILIQGESGTGKEVIARYIHSCGPRSKNSLVAINCGAIPESLIESELFGYEQGAFTDARHRTKGKLEIADGGTLFLDEIGELPLKAQVALLRFLQEREVVPLGGHRRVPVDVRIIAATNANLSTLVADGRFREDLYYRIQVIPITLPSLKERGEDIVPLSQWFLDRFRTEYNRPARAISETAEGILREYSWPGNIRELRNVIERACIMEQNEEITPQSLTIPRHASALQQNHFAAVGIVKLQDLEEAYIKWTLEQVGGNRTRAAEQLGLSVRGLRYRLNNAAPSK